MKMITNMIINVINNNNYTIDKWPSEERSQERSQELSYQNAIIPENT